MVLATMVSYNPFAISASGVQVVLTGQGSAVGPDGVSRCRLRPPTSQAARCVAPHLRYQEKLATWGTGASAGEEENRQACWIPFAGSACQAAALRRANHGGA